ncbi:MAG: undecaprenyl-diphosphate phosphatase [Planctomycetaceae bacterium]|nr:undecaprenyl-diphosphate phosphatase [Planctomycetaceae bacterium]
MLSSEYLQAIVLGIIQGIGEFLPISSSGHLVVFGALFKELFGGPAADKGENALLNVALHLGTLGSILVVYRRDLRFVLRDFKLCCWIIVATIPAAVIGVLFKDQIEATFEKPAIVACGWLMTAAALWYAQKLGQNRRDLSEMNARDAIAIGLCQLASLIFRGFSRSGSTIAGGLFLGFTREAAARFSFLIAIPAIGGAGVVKIGPLLWHALSGSQNSHELANLSRDDIGAMVVGGLVSFFVGWAALRWLLGVIVRRGVRGFAVYCLIVALITFAWQGVEFSRSLDPADSVSPEGGID